MSRMIGNLYQVKKKTNAKIWKHQPSSLQLLFLNENLHSLSTIHGRMFPRQLICSSFVRESLGACGACGSAAYVQNLQIMRRTMSGTTWSRNIFLMLFSITALIVAKLGKLRKVWICTSHGSTETYETF